MHAMYSSKNFIKKTMQNLADCKFEGIAICCWDAFWIWDTLEWDFFKTPTVLNLMSLLSIRNTWDIEDFWFWHLFPIGKHNNALNKTYFVRHLLWLQYECLWHSGCKISNPQIHKSDNTRHLSNSPLKDLECDVHTQSVPALVSKEKKSQIRAQEERAKRKKGGKRQKHSSLTGSSQGGVNPWRGKRERMSAHYSAWHSRPQKIALFIFLVKLWLC